MLGGRGTVYGAAFRTRRSPARSSESTGRLAGTRSMGRPDRGRRLGPLEEPESVLELRDAKLELLVLLTHDEAELTQRAMEARARLLADPDRVAAPARGEVADEGPRLVAAHAAALRELVGEGVRLLGGQRDRADRCEPD